MPRHHEDSGFLQSAFWLANTKPWSCGHDQYRRGQRIQGHISSLGHEPLNYTTFYVQVDDVREYLDKAVGLGGKMLVPPVDIPTGTFAWFADPEGNTIGLWKPK